MRHVVYLCQIKMFVQIPTPVLGSTFPPGLTQRLLHLLFTLFHQPLNCWLLTVLGLDPGFLLLSVYFIIYKNNLKCARETES